GAGGDHGDPTEHVGQHWDRAVRRDRVGRLGRWRARTGTWLRRLFLLAEPDGDDVPALPLTHHDVLRHWRVALELEADLVGARVHLQRLPSQPLGDELAIEEHADVRLVTRVGLRDGH